MNIHTIITAIVACDTGARSSDENPAERSEIDWNSAFAHFSPNVSPRSVASHSSAAYSSIPPTVITSVIHSTTRVCSENRRVSPRARSHSAASTGKPSAPAVISAASENATCRASSRACAFTSSTAFAVSAGMPASSRAAVSWVSDRNGTPAASSVLACCCTDGGTAGFDSIPAAKFGYRPTPIQQTVGYIAQHVEGANYALCERLGGPRYHATAKDSLPDTVKARWPKDTLVARLRASLRFCDAAIERVPHVETTALASTLLAFETDLAEHYSQLATYMRLLGLVPPSALPPRTHTAITLAPGELARFAGTYELARGFVIYDALYAWLRFAAGERHNWPAKAAA